MLKHLLSFLVLLSLGWSGYFVVHNQFYPIAIVNYNFISKKALETVYGSSLIYYGKLKNVEVAQADFEKEIKRATLDKLIENELIFAEVNKADIDNQLASLLSQNKDLEKGAPLAYGISWNSFKDLVLRPQIAEEILQKKLKDLKLDFKEWLTNKKNNAMVFLLARNFKWNGERIEIR